MIEESWKLCPFTYRRQKIEVSTFGNVRVKGEILEKRVSNGRNVVTIGKTGVFAVEDLVAYGFKITNHFRATVYHLDGSPLNDCPYNLIPFLDSFEWAETDRYYVSNDGYKCICGKPNIRELCIIENILTDIKLTLGNCCIDRVSSSDSRFFFKALAKIANDRSRSANKALITFARKQNVLDNWEYVFYSDIWRRHNKTLSPKQLARKEYLNEKLLEYFKVAEIPRGVQ